MARRSRLLGLNQSRRKKRSNLSRHREKRHRFRWIRSLRLHRTAHANRHQSLPFPLRTTAYCHRRHHVRFNVHRSLCHRVQWCNNCRIRYPIRFQSNRNLNECPYLKICLIINFPTASLLCLLHSTAVVFSQVQLDFLRIRRHQFSHFKEISCKPQLLTST